MDIKYEITVRGLVAAFGRRQLKIVMEEAFLEAGLHWGRNFLGKHFTRAGAREYGYAPRKGENARPGSKRFRRVAGPAERKAGEILPLVHGGELRREARLYRVTATSTSKKVYARVRMPGARKANLMPAKFRGELHIISAAEWAALVEVINRKLYSGFKAISTWRRFRIA